MVNSTDRQEKNWKPKNLRDLASALTDDEAGAKEVDVAQMTETLAKLKKVAARRQWKRAVKRVLKL